MTLGCPTSPKARNLKNTVEIMEQFQNVQVGCQGNKIDCVDGYHWFLLLIISGRPTNPSISHQVDGDLLGLAKSQILQVRKS